MSVINTQKDPQAATLTVTAEFDAPPERVWQVWEDPRQLERWWGPPSYPATFDQLEFKVDGWARYHMTGPEGDQPRGWWRLTAIEQPRRLEFEDGFADESGEPIDPDEAVHTVVTLEPANGRTRMTMVSQFIDAEQLDEMINMGMEEGLRQAMDQIDPLVES